MRDVAIALYIFAIVCGAVLVGYIVLCGPELWREAQVELHRIRREMDLDIHHFEVRRDAEQVRREIDDELR